MQNFEVQPGLNEGRCCLLLNSAFCILNYAVRLERPRERVAIAVIIPIVTLPIVTLPIALRTFPNPLRAFAIPIVAVSARLGDVSIAIAGTAPFAIAVGVPPLLAAPLAPEYGMTGAAAAERRAVAVGLGLGRLVLVVLRFGVERQHHERQSRRGQP